MPVQHTPECEEARRRREQAKAEYWVRWPRHCRACGGWGGTAGREFRGYYGSAAAYEDTFDPCDHCWGAGQCPRCRGPLPEEAEQCVACGWTPSARGCPEVEEECGCGWS